jgi:hypothetical protein
VACWDYNWDESSDDDYDDSDAATDDFCKHLSPRSARARQQQLDALGKNCPKVLKPEGAALLRPGSRGAAGAAAAAAGGSRDRSPSPSRPIPEPYQLPTESDDLATVVKTFLQHEVLRYGRRSKLAGTSLSFRHKDKPPAFQSWEPLSSTCAL